MLDRDSVSVGVAGAVGDVGGEIGVLGEWRTLAPLLGESSAIGLVGPRGEEGGELRVSSFASFFRKMLVKIEVRFSLFLMSTFFLSSGFSSLEAADEGEAVGLSREGCEGGVCGVGLLRWESVVFVPSSSEPVLVEVT